MELTYQKLHDICTAFHTLGIQEYRVFEALFAVRVFDGGYTELGEAVGMDVSNTRNAVKKLEKRGLVCVCTIPDKERYVIGFFLIDGWQDELVRTAKNYKHSYEDCKKPRKKKR